MGRDKKNEAQRPHYTKMLRPTMETPAWRALSSTAQALYPWLKLEWRGPDGNNNGRIRLSVRQAAAKMGVSLNTAARAFLDLQAKGFIVVTEPAHLGLSGEARSPALEITEIEAPRSGSHGGRHLYREWSEGRDFPVVSANANNPTGRNGKEKTRLKNDDVDVIVFETKRLEASSK